MADDINHLPISKCSRVVAAMHAGAINPGEMFRLLDELIQPGHEEAFVELVPSNTKRLLEEIYADRKLSRNLYDGKYRTHLAFCEAGYSK